MKLRASWRWLLLSLTLFGACSTNVVIGTRQMDGADASDAAFRQEDAATSDGNDAAALCGTRVCGGGTLCCQANPGVCFPVGDESICNRSCGIETCAIGLICCLPGI